MKRRAQSTTILGALVAVAAAVALAWAPPVSADMHDEQKAFLGQFIRRVVVGEEKVKVVYSAVLGG